MHRRPHYTHTHAHTHSTFILNFDVEHLVLVLLLLLLIASTFHFFLFTSISSPIADTGQDLFYDAFRRRCRNLNKVNVYTLHTYTCARVCVPVQLHLESVKASLRCAALSPTLPCSPLPSLYSPHPFSFSNIAQTDNCELVCTHTRKHVQRARKR